VPVRGIPSEVPATNRLPATVLVDCGAKVAFKVTLFPVPRVKGSVSPLTENPLPVICSAVMVSSEGRSFLTTTGTVELLPIVTGPNDTVEGLAITESALAPVPLTPRGRVGFDALLENSMVPSVAPVAAGVKLTLSSTLCPEGKTTGRLRLDELNSELLKVTAETVTLVSPLFVRETCMVPLWPTTIAPNRRFGGVHASCGVTAPALVGTMPTSAIAMPMVRKWTKRTERD